jgi:3-dehydroquinate synthase
VTRARAQGGPWRPTRFTLRTPGGLSQILVGDGVLAQAGARAAARIKPGPCAVITSRKIFRLHGSRLVRALSAAGFSPSLVFLPDGESTKSIASLRSLYLRFLRARLERRSAIFVLGGGVLCDVGGFAAGTFLRGLPTVLVPTTLLAQVDAAIGGKTAINLPQGKNLVGMFHQPVLILSDTATLATLPSREVRAGLAEVVKIAAALDRRLFARVERLAPRLVRGDRRALTEIVGRAARLKAAIVARDERDLSGVRALLNYGHTVGHALEASRGYRGVLHGEAVAIGIAAACRIGEALGTLPAADAQRQIALLETLGLPVRLPPRVRARSILTHLRRDKKAQGGRIPFVLTASVGSANLANQVTDRLLSRVLDEMGAVGLGG